MASIPTLTAVSDPQHARISDGTNWLLFKIASALETGLGLNGVDWITDASLHSGNWSVFHALTDTVIAGITYKPGYSTGSAAGVTLKAGDRIVGPMLSITLTSGSGVAIRQEI